jgi:hypothetical protein
MRFAYLSAAPSRKGSYKLDVTTLGKRIRLPSLIAVEAVCTDHKNDRRIVWLFGCARQDTRHMQQLMLFSAPLR